MKGKDFLYIKECVECEGFDYAFVHYSNYNEVEDDEFHEKRLAYLKAREELAEYCGVEE